MIDNFALALSHALMALAIWRLLQRDDLDVDPPTDLAAPLEEKTPPARVGKRLRP